MLFSRLALLHGVMVGLLLISFPVFAQLNDECVDAFEAFEGSNVVDTTMATPEVALSLPLPNRMQCPNTVLGDFFKDVWFEYTPLEDGIITVSLCGVDFDSDLAVYEGGCGVLNQLACNGDGPACSALQSEVVGLSVTSGVPYLIRIGGWNAAASGSGTFEVLLETLDEFKRGDVNGDGIVNVTDVPELNDYLYGGGSLLCEDASDVNDDGRLSVTDYFLILANQFLGENPPSGVNYGVCARDDTPDLLDCDTYDTFANCP